MTAPPQGDRPASPRAPKPSGASRLVRALYTHNPFYVISADLVFIGLRMSFDPQAKVFDTWALIFSLAGYTMLLATTACLLVRFGKVWDDMRSVLLLVVMMFLAISSTIDDVLIVRPDVGMACSIGGLLFSILVSEGLFRGMRLGLPALYRLPYYGILALFFLYPLALRPLLARPDGATSHWALFGFSTAAGLAFLSLIPAIRRGASYMKGNGSPWRWPLYPWSLFFFLGLGVCARSYYLCISLHNVEGFRSIFGPYFLVPFGFAVALLRLEGGLKSGSKRAIRTALGMPVLLVGLSMVGHRPDAVYTRFLTLFREGLGTMPPAATLMLALGYFGLAAYRRVPLAGGLAMATLGALSVVGPGTLGFDSLVAPRAWPLLPVAMIQGWMAIRNRESWRALIAAGCAVVVLTGWAPTDLKVTAAFHLTLVAALALGAFRDELGEQLRAYGWLMMAGASMAAVGGEPHLVEGIPPAMVPYYPLVVAAVAASYGYLVGGLPYYLTGGAILIGLLSLLATRGYLILRGRIVGLDRIALGLASFLIAASISVWKAGLPQKWLARRKSASCEPGPPI